MSVFSKFVATENNNILSVNDYFKRPQMLSKMKVKQLKEIAKSHKLKITATKKVLIDRIEKQFLRIKSAICIQSIIRKCLVNKSFKLRGPALKNRNICINDTDFYTIEPLNDIYHKDFFSYQDKSGFIYGFNLNSIITLFENNYHWSNAIKKHVLLNPYNREPIETCVIIQFLSLQTLTQHIYPKEEEQEDKIQNTLYKSNNQIIQYIENIENRENIQQNIINKILRMRSKEMNERIHELFIEIDLQGNYTQSSWFTNLERNDYRNFIVVISEIWNYRIHNRRDICPFYNPFTYEVDDYNPRNRNTTIEEARSYCLSVMENIIYGTNNIENKKLGILHILSALTMVSLPARESIPWLYESISF
jgi:hypothetical protein